jgi:hypothetical protein
MNYAIFLPYPDPIVRTNKPKEWAEALLAGVSLGSKSLTRLTIADYVFGIFNGG